GNLRLDHLLSKDTAESAGSRTRKSFVLSKEHCRRPHVLSSLEIARAAPREIGWAPRAVCLSWLTPPAAFWPAGTGPRQSFALLGSRGRGPVAQVVRAYA